MNNYNSAKEFYNKAYDIIKNRIKSKFGYINDYYIRMGELYHKQRDLINCLYYYQKSIQCLIKNFTQDDIYINPDLEDIISLSDLILSMELKADALFEDQKVTWPLLGANWDRLSEARINRYDFEGFSILVQCNPKRIVSSAAKVDKVSIENRQCFLCTEHRLPEEKNVWFGEDYGHRC